MRKLNGHEDNAQASDWLKSNSQKACLGKNVELESPFAAMGMLTFTTTRENYLALSTKAEHMNTLWYHNST